MGAVGEERNRQDRGTQRTRVSYAGTLARCDRPRLSRSPGRRARWHDGMAAHGTARHGQVGTPDPGVERTPAAPAVSAPVSCSSASPGAARTGVRGSAGPGPSVSAPMADSAGLPKPGAGCRRALVGKSPPARFPSNERPRYLCRILLRWCSETSFPHPLTPD